MGMDPALDVFRLPPSARCWWCGDLATTEEHRIKHSTLRRIARASERTVNPGNVFKKSPDFEGELHSIKKGAQVRWRKNLCANCNNAKSQPFDLAYDVFEAYLLDHVDIMMRWKRLDWSAVYGNDWQEGSRNLARYFGKQMGCMLATQRLPVARELIDFLGGAERCPSVCFMICINWRGGDAHTMMRRHGLKDGLSTFVGLLDTVAYQREGQFSGVRYGYHIGYIWVIGEWLDGTNRSSWFEHPSIDLPRVNDRWRDRLAWHARRVQPEAKHTWRRLRGISLEN